MHKNIIVDTDLEVSIVELKQRLTYSNLLEGIPNSTTNKILIDRALNKAKESFNIPAIHLIEPKVKPIIYKGKYPFGRTESLPEVTCLVLLKSNHAFKNKSMDYSQLGLLWFQDDYAFPIEKKIKDYITTFPYRKLCEEFSFLDE